MELSWPEFPEDIYGQLAFLAAILSLVGGILLLAAPKFHARLLFFAHRENRLGAIGEIRAAGGFIIGLSLATLLFAQPDIYLALGVAFGVAAFGRILALMSDHAASAVNLFLLLIQLGLAGAMMTNLFDIWTPDSQPGLPLEFGERLAFASAGFVAILGGFVMFGPRIALAICGLLAAEGSEAAMASTRGFGGFAFGAGLMVLLVASPMLYLALAVALGASALARLISLGLDRGNFIFQSVALLLTLLLAIPPAAYVFAMV